MGKKLTYEFVKNEFQIHGCELLETEYINSKTKMKYRCKNEHISYMAYSNIQSGRKCKECCKNMKKTFEYVKQFFEKNNYELLETEYINCMTKMKYKCSKNHNSLISYNKLQKGRRCNICSSTNKKTFEYVNQYFKDNEYELLETEYNNSRTKMKCICPKNHKILITYDNFQQGIRCGKCLYKTESIILKFLEKTYHNISFQVKFNWCKNKQKLPFDLLLNDFNIILEIDGIQHFQQVSNWTSPLLNLKNDTYKANLAINNGYKIIRISQEDVFNNRFNWQDLLKKNIEKLNKLEDNIIYLSTDYNLYNKHKFELTKKIIENKLLYLNINKC